MFCYSQQARVNFYMVGKNDHFRLSSRHFCVTWFILFISFLFFSFRVFLKKKKITKPFNVALQWSQFMSVRRSWGYNLNGNLARSTPGLWLRRQSTSLIVLLVVIMAVPVVQRGRRSRMCGTLFAWLVASGIVFFPRRKKKVFSGGKTGCSKVEQRVCSLLRWRLGRGL